MTAMKKHLKLFVALATALVLASCNERGLDVPSVTYQVAFNVSGDEVATRSTVLADAGAVSQVTYYFCNAQGAVVDAVASSQSQVLRNFSAGTYTVYAVVNSGAAVGDYATSAAIKAATRSLTSETAGGFSMFGSAAFSVPADDACTVRVYRLVSMVELDRVSVNFSAKPHLAELTFTVDSIYLINAVGAVTFEDNTSASHATWHNMRWPQAGSLEALLCDAVGATVTQGTPYITPHYFYCYQNNTVTDSRSATWDARYTRLVVACTLGGRRTYYPVDIHHPSGKLLRNCRYVVSNIVVTGYGSNAPDLPVPEDEDYSYSVTVLPWDGLHEVDEQF